MNPREAIITRVYESKFGELILAFKFKKGEFTDEEIRDLRDKWEDGVPQQVDVSDYQVESDHIQTEEKPTLVGQGSIYQRFRLFCLERGVDYEKQKESLNVKHLDELEWSHPLSEIEKLLNERMNEIDRKLGLL